MLAQAKKWRQSDFLLVLWLAVSAWLAAISDQDLTFLSGSTQGDELIASVNLPLSTIEQFSSPAGSGTHRLLLAQSKISDQSEKRLFLSGSPPYILVLKASGAVITDGEAHALWQVGWHINHLTRATAIQPSNKNKALAGEVLSTEIASPPLYLKEDNAAIPVIELLNLHNLRLEQIQIQIWAGIRPDVQLKKLLLWIPLLIGIIGLEIKYKNRSAL